MSTLCRICNEEIEQTRDSTGTREVYVFLGLTYKIDNENQGSIFKISLDTFLEIYKKHVVPKWEDKVANESIKLDYDNYSVQILERPFDLGVINVNEVSADNRRAIESRENSDEQLYEYTLSKVEIGQTVSMCTRLSNLYSFAKSPFESATCLNISGDLKSILDSQQLSRISSESDFDESSYSNCSIENKATNQRYYRNITDKDNDTYYENHHLEIMTKLPSNLLRNTVGFLSDTYHNVKNTVDVLKRENTDNSISMESQLENIRLIPADTNLSQKRVNKSSKKHQKKEEETDKKDIFDL